MEQKNFDEKVIDYFYNLATSSEEANKIIESLSSEELDNLIDRIEGSSGEKEDYIKNDTYK